MTISLSSQIQLTAASLGHLLRPPNPKPPADTTPPRPPLLYSFFCFISFLCGVRLCVTAVLVLVTEGALRAGPPACLADLCVPSTQISAWHLVSTQYILAECLLCARHCAEGFGGIQRYLALTQGSWGSTSVRSLIRNPGVWGYTEDFAEGHRGTGVQPGLGEVPADSRLVAGLSTASPRKESGATRLNEKN